MWHPHEEDSLRLAFSHLPPSASPGNTCLARRLAKCATPKNKVSPSTKAAESEDTQDEVEVQVEVEGRSWGTGTRLPMRQIFASQLRFKPLIHSEKAGVIMSPFKTLCND